VVPAKSPRGSPLRRDLKDASTSVTDQPLGETPPQAKSTILKKKLP